MYRISSPEVVSPGDGLEVVRISVQEWARGPSERPGGTFDACELASLLVEEPFEPIPGTEFLRDSLVPGALLRLLVTKSGGQARTALRWLGLAGTAAVKVAWANCTADLAGETLPDLPACLKDGYVYTPRSVWIARYQESRFSGFRRLTTVLAKFRTTLLEVPAAAGQVQRYLANLSLDDPKLALIGGVISPEQLPALPVAVPALIGALDRIREDHPQEFREFAADQAQVWREFYSACRSLSELKEQAKVLNANIRPDDYLGSNRALRMHVEVLAQAYAVVSRYERFWNVDKNVAPVALLGDFAILRGMLASVRSEVFDKTAPFRDVYQQQWGLPMLRRAVFRAMDLSPEGQEINGLQPGQRRVVIFLIDGFGLTQYCWWRYVSAAQTRRSYGINLFNLLHGRPEFCDTNIAAANLSSDTGSGLTALFTGTLPGQNGVLATQMNLFDRPVKTHKVLDDPAPVLKPGIHSWVDDLPVDVKVRALHGNARESNPFNKLLYGRAEFEGLPNPERACARVVESLKAAADQRSVTIVYNPLIDSTGHEVGSFSMHEQHELQRLNTMLISVLSDLLHELPEVFDGRTTFLFMADHGMYESTGIFMTKQDLLDLLPQVWPRPYIHVMNRALWFFGQNVEQAITAIGPALEAAGMTYEVFRKHDQIYTDLLGTSKYAPEAIITLTGDGIITPFPARRSDVLLYGIHGGRAPEEVFVPMVSLCLTPALREELTELYGRR